MDLATVRTATDDPGPQRLGAPSTTGRTHPARRLRDAMEPVAMADVWAEPSYERAAALGLDFMQAYVRGRAAALGEARPAVVAAAFAVMEPAMIAGVMESTAGVGTAAVVEARTRGAVEGLELAFADDVDPADVDAAVDTLRRGLAAAPTPGRALSAGLAAMAWPEHRLGRLWRATDLWREVRGDGHVAACVAAGLDGPQMNVLTELWIGWEPGRYSATRGWSPEALDLAAADLHDRGLVDGPGLDGVELTDDGRVFRDAIEDTTDASMGPMVAALGDDVDGLVDRLDGWSQLLVERGVFPPDPFKRASG